MSDSPHRIAFCITELDPGGAEQALVEVVTRLDRRQWEPRVYCLAGGGVLGQFQSPSAREGASPSHERTSIKNALEERLQAAEIPVRSLGVTSRCDWGVIGRLRAELAEFQPQLLQTFLFHANICGRLAAWRARVPIIVSGVRVIEHDARWRMRLDRWTSGLVTRIVCVSDAVAATYRSLGFDAAKLSVIRNGVEVERLSAAPVYLADLGIPANARTLLAVGRLHPQKGFDILLDAVQPIFEAHSEWHLLIAGEGAQRSKLEKQISVSPHGSRVHLLGRREDVPSLMRACDLFVLPSRWEGMPNVLLEALAAGMPVVATDVEGVREVVIPGETGLVVDRGSVQALSRGIQSLISRSDAARMGLAGQQRMRDEFSWQRVAGEYHWLYQQLVESTASHGES